MKDLPIAEITLRKYEEPGKVECSERELVKKLCLSLGLLQPGDSRDVVVDILIVLLRARKGSRFLNLKEVQSASEKVREENDLDVRGLAPSNVRRQLKRLRDIFLVEKVKNSYRISEFSSLSKIFEEKVERFYLESILTRIKEYLMGIEGKDL